MRQGLLLSSFYVSSGSLEWLAQGNYTGKGERRNVLSSRTFTQDWRFEEILSPAVFSVSFSGGPASPNPGLELSFKELKRQVKSLWVLCVRRVLRGLVSCSSLGNSEDKR